MHVRTELESLRATLGRGPTDMLLWLADRGGKFGPAGARHIHNDENDLREWRRALESAGLLRCELHKKGRERGYSYELLVDLADPAISTALEQWRKECEEARIAREQRSHLRTPSHTLSLARF